MSHFSFDDVDILRMKEKKRLLNFHIRKMLMKTQSMIEYDGLPKTIPKRELKLLLQINGFGVIPHPDQSPIVNGDPQMYIFRCGLGGVPTPYYRPSQAIISNPALNYNESLTINEQCNIIPHDSMYMGLLPICQYYASQIVETDLSIDLSIVNLRNMAIMMGKDDNMKKSCELFLQKLRDGEQSAIVAKSATDFVADDIRIQPMSTSTLNNTINPLIEYRQYIEGKWYQDVGIQCETNRKRESLNDDEIAINEDTLLPFIDDIVNTQNEAFAKVNEVWGTNIVVRKNSSWKEEKVEEEKVEENDEIE